MKVWAAAARRSEQGLPVFNLTAGQPSTPAPKPVIAAAHQALDDHILGYTEATGIAPLRRAIAEHYERWYHVDVDPRNVVVTTGSSGGFVLAFLAAFDVGARVALARPGYPAYRNTLAALGCDVVLLPCDASTRFQPTVAMLERAIAENGPLDGLIVASPANPTGTMLSPEELADIARFCEDNSIRLISDEIYHGITYRAQDAPAAHPAMPREVSAWKTSRTGFVVNSFSKYFSMTGWRIGWMLVPDDLLDVVDALAGNLAICPPAPAQFSVLHAFDAYDECDAHVARYARNRQQLIDGLRALGIDRLAPADGAFYVWADVSDLTDDSEELCWDLLGTVGLATAPGRDFDPVDGKQFLRFSFAGSGDTIAAALGALGDYLARS